MLQLNLADKLPFVDGLGALPVRTNDATSPQAQFMASIESFQHPDHDTESWPQ